MLADSNGRRRDTDDSLLSATQFTEVGFDDNRASLRRRYESTQVFGTQVSQSLAELAAQM
jgi:hypothetical protein